MNSSATIGIVVLVVAIGIGVWFFGDEKIAEQPLPATPAGTAANGNQHPALASSFGEPLPEWAAGAVAPEPRGGDAPDWTAPLNGSLDIVHRSGRRTQAHFLRYGVATHPDFSTAGYNQPRWHELGGVRGLLIENGWTGYGWSRGLNVPGVMNLLGHAAASADSADADTGLPQGFAPLGQTALRIDANNKVQGDGSLRVEGQGGDASAATEPFRFLLAERHVASWYTQGPDGATLRVAAIEATPDGDGRLLGEAAVTLTEGWQRGHLAFDLPSEQDDGGKVESARLVFTLDGAGPFGLDALQVEPRARYLWRSTPSTWMPGMSRRFAETLTAPGELLSVEHGALALRFVPTSLGAWNCLATWGDGWRPALRLDVRNQGRQVLVNLFGATIRYAAEIRENHPVHIAVSWDANTARIYIDGVEAASGALPPPDKRQAGPLLTLGGTPDDTSPNVRAEGIIADVAAWRTAAPAEVIAALAASPQPAVDTMPEVNLARSMRGGAGLGQTFPRDEPVTLSWNVTGLPNAGNGQPAAPRRALVYIDELGWTELRGPFETVDGGVALPPASFDPSLLTPGRYRLSVVVDMGGGPALRFDEPITIALARIPWSNTQVCHWNSFAPADFDEGFSMSGAWRELTVGAVDRFAANRVYAQQNFEMLGEPRRLDHPADLHWSPARALPSNPSLASSYVRGMIEDGARRLAEQAAAMPNFRAAIINSERHSGGWRIGYNPETIALARERFGLDLAPWRDTGRDRAWVDLPGGRPNPDVVPETIPEGRIVPLDHPLYAFLRWWHGPEGPTEAAIDDVIASKVLSVRDDFFTLCDPALRRPTIRTYAATNAVQDWTYYSDPKLMIGQLEELLCITRGHSHMTAIAMPQFLFKENMAAPFAGHPTADMLRQASWLVASRPSRVITFWNYAGARTKGNQDTPEEIEEKLGGALGWEETVRTMRDKNLRLHSWTPELREEFTAIAHSLWRPFGALLPRWRNAPRRVAIVYSFASDLYSGERWLQRGPLVQMLLDAGVPYDVLYDQDFEPPYVERLDYDVIVLPRCHALTEPAVQWLRGFMERGGAVVVDERFKVALEGVTVIEAGGDGVDAETLRRREAELLEQYAGRTESPQFVEAMEALTQQWAAQTGPNPLAALVAERARLPVRVETPAVTWNLLEAHGARYLVLVNDLRRPGRVYGRYGKVRERGVAQTARLEIDAALGRHIYSLTGHQVLEPRPVNNGQSLALDVPLPPGGGVILMLTAEPAATANSLTLEGPARARRGETVEVAVRMAPGGEAAGGEVAGLIPIELVLEDPSGAQCDLSRYACLEGGRYAWRVSLPANAPAGGWLVRVREFATGQEAVMRFEVR